MRKNVLPIVALCLLSVLARSLTSFFKVKSPTQRCVASLAECEDTLLILSVDTLVEDFYKANKYQHHSPYVPPHPEHVKIAISDASLREAQTVSSFSFEGERYVVNKLNSKALFKKGQLFLGKAFDTFDEADGFAKQVMQEGLIRPQKITADNLSEYLMGDVTPGVSYPFISTSKNLRVAKSFARSANGMVKRKFGVLLAMHFDDVKALDVEKFLEINGIDYHSTDNVGIFAEDEVVLLGSVSPKVFFSALIVENDVRVSEWPNDVPRFFRDQVIREVYERPQ